MTGSFRNRLRRRGKLNPSASICKALLSYAKVFKAELPVLVDCPCVNIARISLSCVSRVVVEVVLEEEVPWLLLVLVLVLVELDAL